VTAIAISRAHFPISTLGPGLRLGVWMQGCSIRCKGCDPPPLNWSTLRYVFGHEEEDRNAAEETHA